MRLVDRSRADRYHHCPRARYLGYEYRGRGLAPVTPSIPLSTGTTVHLGLEELLKGNGVEVAVRRAQAEYDRQIEEYTAITGPLSRERYFTWQEQRSLCEALVRVYERRGLPKLHAEWEIAGVEEEVEWELAPGILFMSRLDGRLIHKVTGDMSVLSFKTNSGYDVDSSMDDFKIDMQSITETTAVRRAGLGDPLSVKMELLVKGSWKKVEAGRGVNGREQDNALVHPYLKIEPNGLMEWAWSYYWTCATPHVTTWKNGRKVACPGGKRHGLGETYSRSALFPVGTGDKPHKTVEEWVAELDAGDVQPDAGDALGNVLYLPDPMTLPVGSEERIQQLAAQEMLIAEFAPKIDHTTDEGRQLLNIHFPQYTHNCNHSYGGKCSFHDICWNARPQAALQDPFSIGYTYRTPHHDRERELVQIGK